MFTNIWNAFKNVIKFTKPIPNIGLKMGLIAMLDLVEAALEIVTPYLLIQEFSLKDKEDTQHVNEAPILLVIGGYGAALMAVRMIPIIRNKLLHPITVDLSTNIARKISNQVFVLPMDRHLSTPITGEANQLISSIFMHIKSYMPSFAGVIVPSAVKTAGTAAILTYLYGPIGLSGLGSLVVINVAALKTSQWIAEAEEAQTKEAYKFFGKFTASFANYENAHYFGRTSYEVKKIGEFADDFGRAIEKKLQLSENSSFFQISVIGFSYVGTLLYVGFNLDTRYTLSDFFIISMYLLQLSTSVQQLGTAFNELQMSSIAIAKIMEFVDKSSDIKETKDAKSLVVNNEKGAHIRFDHVTFGYEDGLILDDVSFKVKPKQKVAIVGASGGGKSTIFRLLYRFYDIQKGRILIDGQDIKTVTLESLREKIALVPQKPVLQNDSLRENILYANPDASNLDIDEAIEKSGLKEFVNKQTLGINTPVGNGGDKLSGGEKQRTATARALLKLKKSSILVLDEATSALDSETKNEVQKNLNEISKGYTTLVVTHDLSAVANCDKIIFLKDGKIRERGNFEKLIRKKGEFYKQMDADCSRFNIKVEDLLKNNEKPSAESKDDVEPKEVESVKKLSASLKDGVKSRKVKKIINIEGLTYQQIPGDGHCLYNAVALHGRYQDAAFLRKIVAAHLEGNLDKFEGFMQLPSGMTIKEYIKAIHSGNEWADNVEIEIIMRVLDQPIVVILPNGKIRNEEDIKRFKGNPIFVFYNNHNHYDAFLLKNGYSAKSVLEKLLAKNKNSNNVEEAIVEIDEESSSDDEFNFDGEEKQSYSQSELLINQGSNTWRKSVDKNKKKSSGEETPLLEDEVVYLNQDKNQNASDQESKCCVM